MSRTKRILCFIDSLSSGGAQRQLVGLASLLKKKDYVVKVITYYDFDFYKHALSENDVEYEPLPCGKGLFQRLIKIDRSINKFSPDIVISYLDTPNILACILRAKKSNWKLIVSERNTTQLISKRDRIKFFLYKYADAIVPNSYSQSDFIAQNYPRLMWKCNVITNFVDTDSFSPSNKIQKNGDFRIIGVGRIALQKNIPILIDAIKEVIEKGYKVRVDWYGNRFESYDGCIEMINKYNLEKAFFFHDPFNPIVEKLRESDLFVLPSLYEGFPNVLCEALSCGLPAIASDVCDNSRIIKNGINGFLFPSGDKQKLVKCILKIIEMSNEERIKITNNCRKKALESFSAELFVQKYIHLIEQLKSNSH